MMDNTDRRDIIDLIAKIISLIFHPLFIPLYGLIIVFSAPTLLGYLPLSLKKMLFFIVLINNVLLPLSLLPYLKYRNYISSWEIENRRERMLPLFLTTLLYAATSYIMIRFPVPGFLKTFILGAFFLSLLVTIINFWWKISLHSLGAGAVTALILILSLKMSTPLLWYLIMAIIVSGLVLSARLKLNSHTPSEVWTGYFTGLTGLGLFLWFF